MKLIFIETQLFTDLVTKYIDDEALRKLQSDLMGNPEKGDLVPGTGGLRKVRMAFGGKGKRGGARIIYLYLKDAAIIYLLLMYRKSKTENLSASQTKRLRELAKQITREFHNEKKQNKRPPAGI